MKMGRMGTGRILGRGRVKIGRKRLVGRTGRRRIGMGR